MPRADELPGSLAKLVRRQALELSPARFDFDTGRLLRVLDNALAEVRAGQPASSPTPSVASAARPRHRRRWTRTRVLAGAGVVLLLLTAAVIAYSQRTPPSAEDGGGSGVLGLAVVPRNDCTRKYFAQRPPVDSSRVRSVELDAVDRRVLGIGERQDTEFGLVFSDTLSSTVPQVLGAMKLFRRPGVGFRVIGVVDQQTCKPVGVSDASAPGVPAREALGDYERVLFVLGGKPYVLLLNSSNDNTEVLVTLTKRG